MTNSTSDLKDLVYGERGGSLVFIPRDLALELASLWGALRTAKTWGELRRQIGEERYQHILASYFEDYYDAQSMERDLTTEQAMTEFECLKNCRELRIGDRPSDGDDAFDIQTVPSFADGDWPEWPAQEMLEWVPRAIRDEYGTIKTSVLNGNFLEFPSSREHAIVAAFSFPWLSVRKEPELETVLRWYQLANGSGADGCRR